MKRTVRASLVALSLLAGAAPLASHAMPGGPGGPGLGVPLQLMEALKPGLKLDTTQQGQWDKAVAQSRAAREAMRASRLQVRSVLDAELAKAEPDLAAVARAADAARESGRALGRQAREEWLALYNILRPDQKALVRDAIAARLQRGDAFRERMKQKFGAG